jgi:hypothetical protein
MGRRCRQQIFMLNPHSIIKCLMNKDRMPNMSVYLYKTVSLVVIQIQKLLRLSLCAVCLVRAKVGHSEVGGGTRVHL